MKILLIPLDFHLHESHPLFFTDLVNGFDQAYMRTIATYNPVIPHPFANKIVEREDLWPLLYRNLPEAIEFKPEVIFYQGSVSKEDCIKLKSETGAKFVMWTGDCRYFPTESLMDMREVVDMYLVPFTGKILDVHEQLLKKPCRFIFEALHDWKIIQPQELTEGSVVFVGNIYNNLAGGKSRAKIHKFLTENNAIDTTDFYGNGFWSTIKNEDVPKLYNSSYIVIAESNTLDADNYFTPRNLLAMSNSCCVARYFPGIENHFTNLHDCIYYRHKYELLEAIQFLKKYPEERNRIAMNGHKHIKENYTYKAFAKRFVELVSE